MLGIEKIANATKVPIIAIGGITPGAVAEMHVAGAVGVAVMGGVMRAEDPGDEVKRLMPRMQKLARQRVGIIARDRAGRPGPAPRRRRAACPACQNTSIGMPPRGKK